MRFHIVELEVWGNAKDGYEVNSAHYTNKFIELDDWEYEAKDFILALNKAGYELPENVVIDGDLAFTLYVESEDGKPLLNLEGVPG